MYFYVHRRAIDYIEIPAKILFIAVPLLKTELLSYSKLNNCPVNLTVNYKLSNVQVLSYTF